MPRSELLVRHQPASGPDAPLVVLVHGAPDRSGAFRQVIERLGDLEVIAYDRRGYGRSSGLPLARGIDDHVDDLVAILGDREATLVGHSTGSNIALATAIRRSDLVRSVGVWEVPMPWASWWPNEDFCETVRQLAATVDTDALGERSARNALGDAGWDALDDDKRARLRAEGAAYKADMQSFLTAPYDIEQLKVPAVFAAGALTTTGHREAAAILAERLNADHLEIEDAGHFGPTQHPVEFVELVRRAVGLGWSERAA